MMQTRESERLKEVCQRLPELTGLSWELISIATRTELRSERCRNLAQIEFIEQKILQETFHWNHQPDKHFYDIIVDDESCIIQIFPVLTQHDVRMLCQIYDSQKVKHDQDEQNAWRLVNRLTKITGVAWDVSTEAFFFSPMLLLAPRKGEQDEVIKFAEALNCFSEQAGLNTVTLVKTRVRGKQYWQVKEEELASVFEAYYAFCQEQRRQDLYRARKLAKKLMRLFDERIDIDVVETECFTDPLCLFLETSSEQMRDVEHFLRQEKLLETNAKKSGNQLFFEVNHISLIALERLHELHVSQRQQNESHLLKNECQFLLSQLQSVVQTENSHLHKQLLNIVQETEQRLTTRMDKTEKRLIERFDQRLQDFEESVMTTLKKQGVKLDEIQALVRRSQEYLIESHEQHMQRYQQQQQWLQTTLGHLSQDVAKALSDDWQGQLQQHLAQQLATQEKRLQTYLTETRNIDRAAIEATLQDFQTTFLQKQEDQAQAYQTALHAYTETHGPQLNRLYEKMTQMEEQFSMLETHLNQQIHHVNSQTSSQDVVATLQKSVQDSSLLSDGKQFGRDLLQAGSGILNHKVGLESAVKNVLQQNCQQQLETHAIDYLCQTFITQLTSHSAKPELNDLGLFVVSFQRKVKESLQVLQRVGQGGDHQDHRLGDHLAGAAETVADFFSIAIPGLRLIVKAAAFGTRKFLEYREQCFIDRIDDFLQGEEVDGLLFDVGRRFRERYHYQLTQLTSRGMESLIDHYLIPCLLAEMAKEHGRGLSTEQKKYCLLLSGQHKTPLLPVKLVTQQPRKYPWTAAGLVLGPMVVVDGKRYRRTDNPLNILPWQPRPHRLYGERLGDAEEIDLSKYELVNEASAMPALSSQVSWQGQQFSLDYFFHHPDAWEEQEPTEHKTCWQILIEEGTFLRQFIALVDRIEQEKSPLKLQLLASLCLTDHQERNILHVYFATQTDNIHTLYQQLKRLDINNTARWDQQVDKNGYLPLEGLYQRWQKQKNVVALSQALSEALSAWFSESDLTTLPPLVKRYPLAEVVFSELRFTSPSITPFISLYRKNQKAFLLTFVDDKNHVFQDRDEHHESLLHYLVRNNDADLFESIAAQLSFEEMSYALSQPNKTLETPLVLAVKLKQIDILWRICQDDRLASQPQPCWGISDAKQLAQHQPLLSAPLDVLTQQTQKTGKSKQSKYFGLPSFSLFQKPTLAITNGVTMKNP